MFRKKLGARTYPKFVYRVFTYCLNMRMLALLCLFVCNFVRLSEHPVSWTHVLFSIISACTTVLKPSSNEIYILRTSTYMLQPLVLSKATVKAVVKAEEHEYNNVNGQHHR